MRRASRFDPGMKALPFAVGSHSSSHLCHGVHCTEFVIHTALPVCISTQEVSDPARGITFAPCYPSHPSTPNGITVAHVSITPESGFEPQFWDIAPRLDTYWLKQYLEPHVTCAEGFRVQCWKSPEAGCAVPHRSFSGSKLQLGRERELKASSTGEEAEGKRSRDRVDDDNLVPLMDPSVGHGLVAL